MKSTAKTTTTLTRHSDTGNITTTYTYVCGMPEILVIEQKGPSGQVQKIELTMPEVEFTQYQLAEVNNIRYRVSNLDKSQSEEEHDEVDTLRKPRLAGLFR